MANNTIGRYEIRDELGEGGMGAVYLAYDPDLGREVALKVLHPHLFSHNPEFALRFKQEARAIATLEHSHIVPIYEFGEAGEWLYFVMRLMKGGTLRDRLQNEPLPLDEIIAILEGVGSAVDRAHSAGIVHRDLKPGNIMFDEEGNAFLGDFGIVKTADAEDIQTRTGQALGTPHYMSPEQLDGADVDGRSDIYALGVILFEMATGVRPYDHPTSTVRIMAMHLTNPIPSLLEKNPDLPPAMEAIIQRAMAKDATDRYANAAEMIAALKAVRGAAAAAPPPVEPPAEAEPVAVAAPPEASAPTATQEAPATEPEPPLAEVEAVATAAPPEPAAAPPPEEAPVPEPELPAAKPVPAVAAAKPAAVAPESAPAAAPVAPPGPAAATPAAVKPAPAVPPPQAAPATPTPTPTETGPTPQKKSSKRPLIFAGIAVIAVVGIIAVVVVLAMSGVFGGSQENGSTPAAEAAAESSETAAQIAANGVIRVAMMDYDDLPLFAWTDQNIEGFEVDLLESIFDEVVGPIEIEWVPMNRNAALDALQAGDVQLLAGGTAHFQSREVYGLWSDNYFVTGQRMMVRPDSGISDLSQMDGATVCVVEGSSEEVVVALYFAERGMSVDTLRMPDYESALDPFNAGGCDGYVAEWILQLQLIESSGTQAIILDGILTAIEATDEGEFEAGIYPLAFGLPPGDTAFQSAFNEGLTIVIENGTWQRLYDKWFADPPPWTLQEMQAQAPLDR